MRKCCKCKFFFLIPEDADDYEAGRGDCVRKFQDDKGHWWSSRHVNENGSCTEFQSQN